MRLNMEDRDRIWRALASYLEECETLATESESDASNYYRAEIEESRVLRARIKSEQE